MDAAYFQRKGILQDRFYFFIWWIHFNSLDNVFIYFFPFLKLILKKLAIRGGETKKQQLYTDNQVFLDVWKGC